MSADDEPRRDDLTGLANRRAYEEALELEVERSRRSGGRLGLVVVDVEEFISTLGHLEGDEVVREIGRILRESCREVDLPARYGDETLAVVLPGIDMEGAFELAERMRYRISGLRLPGISGEAGPKVTASFGVASLPEIAHDGRTLTAAAFASLLQTKRKTSRDRLAPQKFSANGPHNLGTIEVPGQSTLEWTNSGEFFAAISDDPAINITSKAPDGTIAVSTGSYHGVEVIADGHWTITITPR